MKPIELARSYLANPDQHVISLDPAASKIVCEALLKVEQLIGTLHFYGTIDNWRGLPDLSESCRVICEPLEKIGAESFGGKFARNAIKFWEEDNK